MCITFKRPIIVHRLAVRPQCSGESALIWVAGAERGPWKKHEDSRKNKKQKTQNLAGGYTRNKMAFTARGCFRLEKIASCIQDVFRCTSTLFGLVIFSILISHLQQ